MSKETEGTPEFRPPELIDWVDGSGFYHLIKEEGAMFHWRRWSPPDEKGKQRIDDFGLIPGGAFVAIESLIRKNEGVS